MWTCTSGHQNQIWTLADNGSVQGLGKCLDVANDSTANGAVIHLWDCFDTVATQKWTLTAARDLVNTASGKCLDIKDNNLADGAKLQMWTAAAAPTRSGRFPGADDHADHAADHRADRTPATRTSGPNVTIFDPSMSASTIQSRLTTRLQPAGRATSSATRGTRCCSSRARTTWTPTSASSPRSPASASLPDQVNINGQVHAEADWWPDGSQNATQNFWRSAEGLSVTPTGGLDRWAVSQAAPYRRMHVRGNLALSDGGWSSGGFIADTKIDGQIQSGIAAAVAHPQLGRWASWSGSNWNQVFVGHQGAPAQQLPDPAVHHGRRRPRWSREKPYLYVDSSRRLPGLRARAADQRDRHHLGERQPGRHVAADQHVLRRQARRHRGARSTPPSPPGKNLLVTPGVYHLNQTLNVTRANTVVLGLGLATLVPRRRRHRDATSPTWTASRLAGVLFDAGTTNSHGPDGGRPDRLDRLARRQPDLAVRRVLPDRRLDRRQGHRQRCGSTATT